MGNLLQLFRSLQVEGDEDNFPQDEILQTQMCFHIAPVNASHSRYRKVWERSKHIVQVKELQAVSREQSSQQSHQIKSTNIVLLCSVFSDGTSFAFECV